MVVGGGYFGLEYFSYFSVESRIDLLISCLDVTRTEWCEMYLYPEYAIVEDTCMYSFLF